MKKIRSFFYRLVLLLLLSCQAERTSSVLSPEKFSSYIDSFNQNDNELYKQAFPNSTAFHFLAENIPLVELPNKDLEETYYFRWWTFRKHIK